jgi:hypothetical protein
MRKVLIFDTSVICCFLKVPGKDTAGARDDLWDHDRISKLVSAERRAKSVFVLPLATIIETGNHISHSSSRRRETALKLTDLISAAADAQSPWAPFTDQADLWSVKCLKKLAESWPELAAGGMSIGDATIKDVAEYYAAAGFEVEIITGDEGLRAYQPAKQVLRPRRRQ